MPFGDALANGGGAQALQTPELLEQPLVGRDPALAASSSAASSGDVRWNAGGYGVSARMTMGWLGAGKRLSRTLLVATLTAIALIFGLLAMHSYAAPHTSMSGSDAPAAAAPASAPIDGVDLTATPAPESGCEAACTGAHPGLLVICILALLIVVVLRRAPQTLPTPRLWRVRHSLVSTRLVPRPPSLHRLSVLRL